MRPPRRRSPPDRLSRALASHALAEDACRESERTAAALRERMFRARAAARERRRRGEEALLRGEECQGLALLDAAAEAEGTAVESLGRLEALGRRGRRLAAVEQAWRRELFRQIECFLAAVEGEGAR